jgi:hypothetical protein
MKGKATKIAVALAIIAGAGVLWWRRMPVPPAPVGSPTNAVVSPTARPRLETRVPPAPFAATNDFMRYEVGGGDLVWGSMTLWPAFWGYDNRVELPEVSARELAWIRLADELEGLLPPLAVVRWTSDWSEFLNRWLDPRLTSQRGVGFFNPNATYEGLKLLPTSKEADFGFGLKYKWTF